jgi:hypothetical protein
MAAPKGQPDTIQVQMALGNNPFDATYTWTDVTPYCRSFRTKRGRQHELNRVEAGTFSGVFDNRDARFHPWNTNSPYAGQLLVMVPLRVNAIYSAVTYNIWQGFVTAYRGVWADTASTDMTIEATDGFRALALLTVPHPYVSTVLKDTPIGYWRLAEASNASPALDSSGNGNGGFYSGSLTLGAASLVGDPTDKAVTIAGDAGAVLLPASVAVSGTSNWSVEGLLSTTATSQGQFLFTQGQSGISAAALGIGSFGPGIVHAFVPGIGTAIKSTTAYNDGLPHHYVLTHSAAGVVTLYVDAVVIGSASGGTGFIDSTQVPPAIGVGIFTPSLAATYVADEVSIYNSVLSPTQVTAHYNAAHGRVNDLTGARIGWILDQAGWPAALRSVDPGLDTLVGMTGPVGALSHILDVTLSENGLAFVAGNGNFTFFERDHVLKPPYITSQATFGDGGNLPFLLAQTELALDDLDIYNSAVVTPAVGGPMTASDATSETQYVTRTISPNLLTANPLTALAAAQWLVNHYKQPYERIRAIVVDALSNPALMWPQMLGRELWDRITVSRTFFPSAPGAALPTAFSQPYLIEGIEHEWVAGYWKTTLRLSPAETQLYLILDNATLGKLDSGNQLAY